MWRGRQCATTSAASDHCSFSLLISIKDIHDCQWSGGFPLVNDGSLCVNMRYVCMWTAHTPLSLSHHMLTHPCHFHASHAHAPVTLTSHAHTPITLTSHAHTPLSLSHITCEGSTYLRTFFWGGGKMIRGKCPWIGVWGLPSGKC